ncbi:hypothetical protein SADUNF_Sadunf10G0182500 [Salix dunnii]|uniref:Uncharacterized protein n=1 Tax=Salix dunnii TaxID=1413687 RepID=A0A835JUJ2_9ROSI|nr:hypothetical protein SADUNF_Sadunf10G0182500 [Salix dunnii]
MKSSSLSAHSSSMARLKMPDEWGHCTANYNLEVQTKPYNEFKSIGGDRKVDEKDVEKECCIYMHL